MKLGLFRFGPVVLALSTLPALSLFPASLSQGTHFKLRETSVFQGNNRAFVRGQYTPCQEDPLPEVALPSFVSKKTLYGSVQFAAQYGQPDSGLTYHFALDESRGTGQGYDRFYFDANRDRDLRNDPVLAPERNPSKDALLNYSGIKQQVIFKPLALDFDLGPAGSDPVELLPRLLITGGDAEDHPQLYFIRTRLCQGKIRIGDQEFHARLGNDYLMTGRLDSPGAALILTREADSDQEAFSWWGGDRLMALHKVQGRYYQFSATPTGQELVVAPYRGELGTFELGAGRRNLSELTMNGSLQSESRAVAVGEVAKQSWPDPVRRCQLPVGDYLPSYLSLKFGYLRINLSENYHADGKPRDRGGRPKVFGIKISKEIPFILDFSNPPEVMFASPVKDQRIKPGQELEVKAVLIDPQLDIMIRGLNDTTRKQTKTPNGAPLRYERDLSLDPTVVITRSDGQKLAEGVMPFG